MSLIDGLTSILKGSGNSSIDDINVYVTNTSAIPVEDVNLKSYLEQQGLNLDAQNVTSNKKESINVRMKPSPDDFVTMKSLSEIVPNGFLLIHNDLEELKSKSGAGGSLLGGGLAGLVAGATSGLISGLFDGLFGDGTKSHMNSIADELNQDLTADDFRGNPDIEQVQRDAFVQYLKVYYLEQTAALAGSAVGNFAGTAISTTIQETIKGIFDFGAPEYTKTKLYEIAEELDKTLTIESITSSSEAMADVRDVQKDSVIAYLKTYYAAQVSEMAGATVGNFFGGAIKEALSGVIEGTIGSFLTLIGKNEKEADSLQKIADELTARINIEDFVDDPGVLKTQKDSIISYLNLYYEAQINEMSGQSKSTELGGEVKTLLTSVVDGTIGAFLELFGVNQKPASKLNDIADSLTEAINISDYTSDQDILDIQKDAITQYLRVYYESQINEMEGSALSQDIKDKISGAIKGFIGGVFDGLASILGIKTEENSTPVFATKVQDIISTLDTNLNVENVSKDSSVIEIQKDVILKYISVYYQTQIDQLDDAENQTWYGNLFGNIGSALNNFWTNLTGSNADSQFMVAVGDIAQINDEQVTAFSKDSDILDIKKDAVKNVISQLLKIEGNAILDHYKVKDGWFSGYKDKVNKALEGFADAYLNSISVAIGYTQSANTFNESVGSMSPSGDISNIRGNVSTMNTRINNIYNLLQQIADNITPSVIALPTGEEGGSDDILL